MTLKFFSTSPTTNTISIIFKGCRQIRKVGTRLSCKFELASETSLPSSQRGFLFFLYSLKKLVLTDMNHIGV